MQRGQGSSTSDWSDKAIQKRMQRVRQDVDAHLRKAPVRAEEVAFATGDTSMLAPRVGQPRSRKKAPRPKRERAHVERINPLEWMS
jgi:hypothetical protein